MDGDGWQDDGGFAGECDGLPPLAARQALAAVLAQRLPLAADAVLLGRLGAEQLCAVVEGVEQLTRAGHGPDVIAELERRLVDLASARPGVNLAGPAAEYVAELGGLDGGPAGVDREHLASDVETVSVDVRAATGPVLQVAVAATGRVPAPVTGAELPADRADPRDGAARAPGARRPGPAGPRGREVVPARGRARARGPPRPDRTGCRPRALVRPSRAP